MVKWLPLILWGLKALSSLTTHLQKKQLIGEGERRAIAEALKVQHDELIRANKAREDQRSRNAAVPRSHSLPDDGFRRD